MKIIITGAASGIGKEIIKHCLEERVKVIACDINDVLLEDLQQNIGTDFLYTL